MTHHTRVAIIGGGVTGCSVLYHLARMGWTDITLIERSELTSGSSWHAAGNLFTLTSPSSAQRLQAYTIGLYPELERESGQSIGYHPTGGFYLASSNDEVEALTVLRAQGRRNGIETDWIDLAELKQQAPIVDISKIKAALWEKNRGHVDPSSVTQAYAAAARKLGATIFRHRPVTATIQQDDGSWRIETPEGPIHAEFIVNAAGLWAREVAALAGIKLPLIPLEHQYLVTESLAEIEAMEHELPNISEGEIGFYMRQEGQGLLLGAYEEPCHHWSVNTTPLDFGHELLENDLSRLDAKIEAVCERIPVLAEAGIKRIVNGPMIFSPDLEPLIGPHPALKNYYCAAGVMTGFNQAGGIGKVLAEWMIEGEPELDVNFWDVARYGRWAGKHFTFERTKYYYEHRDEYPYPERECPAGRPLRTFPAYDLQKANAAVFGQSNGFETPLWYPQQEDQAYDIYSWRRANWFKTVGDECRATRSTAGLFEISTFAKYRVSGSGAEAALDHLLAGRLPQSVERMALCPMLSPNGRLIGDFSVARLASQSFLLLGSGAMNGIHRRWFREKLEQHNLVLEDLTETWGGVMIAGPAATTILSKIASDGTDAVNMPFLGIRSIDLGPAAESLTARISFTGESGFEIYTPMYNQRALFDGLMQAGQDEGLRLAGGRALMELRLEKSYPAWGLELTPDYGPAETGLSRFVDWRKSNFIGRDAALAARDRAPVEALTTLVVDATDADCAGGEPVYHDGDYIGYVSSGGYGHNVDESLALAYLRPEFILNDCELEVEILGRRRPARVSLQARFDPSGTRMRG